MKSVDPVLVRAARSFGATNRQILFKVAFPAALPMIMAGWRLGAGRALIGVIVGEMFGANAGLGFRISYYGARIQTDNLFAPLALVILTGLVITQFLRWLEGRLFAWRD